MASAPPVVADPRSIHRRPAILARLLGGLFTAMAAFQLADLPGFVGVLEAFQLGGSGTAWILAVMLLAGELVSGLWLLSCPPPSPSSRRSSSPLTSVLWSALAAQAFARGLTLANCGCFGVYLAQPLRWWVLLQDTALLGYSAVLLRTATAAPRVHVARRRR
ncbi:MAG TPA: MauE/DoxX family redox-associated membrane protein [Pseudonocardiaceae bacterium]|nr:MauE/DoxX family redox-associated membrane protein [Pseudonocardiaceae bacterium]